jgi:hypothetical protein
MEFTHTLDLDLLPYSPPQAAIFPIAYRELSMPPLHRTAVIIALVHIHMSLYQINQHLADKAATTTPRPGSLDNGQPTRCCHIDNGVATKPGPEPEPSPSPAKALYQGPAHVSSKPEPR